jgi:hypothetical protein
LKRIKKNKKNKLYKKLSKIKLKMLLNGGILFFDSFTLFTSPRLENKKLDP